MILPFFTRLCIVLWLFHNILNRKYILYFSEFTIGYSIVLESKSSTFIKVDVNYPTQQP